MKKIGLRELQRSGGDWEESLEVVRKGLVIGYILTPGDYRALGQSQAVDCKACLKLQAAYPKPPHIVLKKRMGLRQFQEGVSWKENIEITRRGQVIGVLLIPLDYRALEAANQVPKCKWHTKLQQVYRDHPTIGQHPPRYGFSMTPAEREEAWPAQQAILKLLEDDYPDHIPPDGSDLPPPLLPSDLVKNWGRPKENDAK